MAERIGFIVMETAEDYEQGLRLLSGDSLPQGGILDWRGMKGHVAVFPDRSSARAAIMRTEHYRLAYGRKDLPEKQFCKIVSIAKVSP